MNKYGFNDPKITKHGNRTNLDVQEMWRNFECLNFKSINVNAVTCEEYTDFVFMVYF